MPRTLLLAGSNAPSLDNPMFRHRSSESALLSGTCIAFLQQDDEQHAFSIPRPAEVARKRHNTEGLHSRESGNSLCSDASDK